MSIVKKIGRWGVFFIVSVFTVLVEHVRASGELQVSSATEIITSIMQVIIYTGLFLLASRALEWFDQKAVGKDRGEQHLFYCWNRRSVVLTALLLAGLYLPYLIIFYPGVASYDTVNQIKDYVTGTMPIEISWNAGEPTVSCFLNDHHPVTDTFLFTFFTEHLGGFLGGARSGAYLYCGLQAVVTAFLMALMLCRMEKLGIPYLYRKAGGLFLGLAPFVGLYVIGMLKDSVYAMVFIAYFLLYVLIVLEGADNRRMILLVLLSVLLALTKKTGVYFVVLCNLPLLLVRSVRQKIAVWAVSWCLPALIVLLLLPRVIFPLCNIYPGGKQESLGFTMQMVARTYLDHKKEITPEEAQIINGVMDLQKLEEAYSGYNYDEVKHLYNFGASESQLSAYKRLWLRLFVRYPLSGMKALFGTAGGFFTPTETIRVYYEFPESEYVQIRNPDSLKPMREGVKAVYKWLGNFPGAGLVLQCVLYTWWLPLLVLLRILFGEEQLSAEGGSCQKVKLICLIPIAVCVVILWVSPYSMGRYGLPQIYTIPLVMGLGSRAVCAGVQSK